MLRDAEHHASTKAIVKLRVEPQFAASGDVLGAKLIAKQRPMLRLALSHWTWRTLVRDAGLKSAAAATAMVEAIECAR